ncbi:LysR substrate-binding domain-containing protein [Pseudomonas putida]|uniref:LysR substrate-binding domain-containing protein n=1 Tax=Pseudomonas putida TaxID=303 RepID=UPI0039C62927
MALHELGSNLRTEVLSAVSALGRQYRVVYGSPNMRGQIATAESGLAVAVMSRCCVPPSLKILDARYGLPALPKMEVALVRSKDSARSLAVDMLYNEALHGLKQER